MWYQETAWGGFEVASEEDGPLGSYLIKNLYIFPGCCMSNQRHQGRSESWNIVEGSLNMSLDDIDLDVLNAGDWLRVPSNTWHCAFNLTDEVVEVTEIWCGQDLREDDIERKPYTGILEDLGWVYGQNELPRWDGNDE
jgi:mannose-6-phosphate isomerase-like protein (cupin superfamily)